MKEQTSESVLSERKREHARHTFVRALVQQPLLYPCLCLVSTMACHNPIDGVKIGLKDPIQEGVLAYQFYDPAGNPLPTENNIRISGPDAQQVVTTLNSTRYKINSDGNLLLAASPGTIISPQKPFRYTVVVEAADYLPVVQPVILTDLNRQTRTIRRINIRKPPSTLNAAQTAGSAGTNGQVVTSFGVTTAAQNTEADHATVTLLSGTKLADRDGQIVGGNITLTVMHTNARTDQSASFIPGKGILSGVAGRNGGPSLGTLRFLSIAGSVTMQLYNERYELIRNMAPAARWTMDLNPATFNTTAGRVIQAGDSIPLFSYDDFTSRWQAERPGVVVRDQQTGRLAYQAGATQAAAYVAGWTESICAIGPVFSVSSKLANVDVNYLCKLVDVTTGRQASSFYANVSNGAVITATNQSKNRRLKLQVYDETDAWGKGAKGGLIAESAAGVSCDQTPVSINLATLPVPPVMKLEFSFSCPGGTKLDESTLPALIITQYSEVGQNNWHNLITATRTSRKAASYKLKIGRYYDFRASTDGGATWPLHQNNYLVDKPEWTLKIRGRNVLQMKILILRFSSIGDIVLTTPVVRCLKQAINGVEIHYCTKRRYQELIDPNPYIDRGYYLDDSLPQLVNQLRTEKYDLIIDLHNSLRTKLIKLQLGRRAFTVNKINVQKWLYVRFKVNVMPAVHIVDRYMDTLKELGVTNDGKGLDHFISATDHVSLSQLPYTHRASYVAYAMGGQHATKRLPLARMVELCRKIGGPVVLLGDQHDRPMGECIRQELGDELIYNACGLHTINQSASLVEQAQMVFCHDTGLMHIASALKKPVVSIWGSTTPQLGMYPYKTQAVIIENTTLPCRPCSKIGHDQCPLGHFKCMNDLSLSIDPAFIWEDKLVSQ